MSEESDRTSIDPIAVRPGMIINPFDNRDLERIHQATLTLLEETGVKFPSPRALKVFAGDIYPALSGKNTI